MALRVVLWGGHRPLGQALAEVGLFSLTYLALAFRRERDLLGEVTGALRSRGAT